jgi:hypothetical protein
MKISQSIMLSMVAALFFVPFTSAVAEDEDGGGCDYDLRKGAVYFNENRVKRDDDGNAQQNRLVVFSRAVDGTLTEVQRAESGGYGNDAGIVTSGQFSVIVQAYERRQYVMMINPGFDPTSDSLDGSVSAFRVNKCDVTLTDTASTLGQEPRAVTRDSRRVLGFSRDLVAVINAGSGADTFNGCPGLPEGFLAPTGITCGPRQLVSEEDFEPTSYTIYRFNNRRGTFRRIANADTRDDNGDPAQISFLNEGRQLLVSHRNTFFALGNGTEDDIIEVIKLRLNGRPMADRSGFATALASLLGYNQDGASPDDIAPRFTNPVVSETSGNDNFGFSVLPVDGEDFNDCVVMTHGSFQQRGQGGTSQFTINKFGAKVRVQPNKPDLGDDTCWSQISTRTGGVYAQAFFNSGISVRTMDLETCVMADGGPPVTVVDGVPQFSGVVENFRHRISSSPANDANGGLIPTDQSDFLYQAGGLDLALSQNTNHTEYLYALNTPVPFGIGQNSSGDWLYPPGGFTTIAIYKVIEDCTGVDTIWNKSNGDDDCRVGDLVMIGRYTDSEENPLPSSGFGIAAW